MIETRQAGYEVRSRKLLQDINLKVLPGQFWAVVGANGAGSGF